jgi:hypothetical protein
MSFGQAQGRPASAKQLQYLLALLQAAGHEGFRDARGPMGFTQRQAGGKFTIDEASAFIDQLTAAEHDEPAPPAPAPPPAATSTTTAAAPKTVRSIRDIPDDRLVAELERRGFTVTPPT